MLNNPVLFGTTLELSNHKIGPLSPVSSHATAKPAFLQQWCAEYAKLSDPPSLFDLNTDQKLLVTGRRAVHRQRKYMEHFLWRSKSASWSLHLLNSQPLQEGPENVSNGAFSDWYFPF